jgi:ribokinase
MIRAVAFRVEAEQLLGRRDLLVTDGRAVRLAGLLTGVELNSEKDALRAARDLLRQGPDLVAPAVEDGGNLFAWPDGNVFFPLASLLGRAERQHGHVIS